MKFACPKCKSRVEIQRTFNKRMHVSCTGCKLQDILGFAANPDEVFLEFLERYDRGLVGGDGVGGDIGDGLEDAGLVRPEPEIRAMVGDRKIDGITRGALYSKRDYVAQYKVIESPEPEMGCGVDGMGLGDALAKSLENAGISRFYKFQEDATRLIMAGKSAVIEAPTASGKTEAFLVPILERISKEGRDGTIHTILVYPTKALARDQLQKIARLASGTGAKVAVFDGDSKPQERRRVTDAPPHILITNFDVLHYHMWHRTRFAALLRTARILVADEAHVYSGIFGSNVHYIIKRLGRLCHTPLQFVAASATLGDAPKFCAELFGVPMSRVAGSGRRGRTDFAMIFPSLRSQRALMVDLASSLAGAGRKSMVFSNSHINSELLAIQARRKGINIKVHRAGLMPGYRGMVEKQFRQGYLDAISCTPTLELGIDIGDVDGVVSATIPVNRLTQRIGRAARKGQRGYAFLALGNDPISQYYKNHPGDYFEDIEQAYIDPKNPFVEGYHVLAMACDRPISGGEVPEHGDAIKFHVKAGTLAWSNDTLVPDMEKAGKALSSYSIRGIGSSLDITHQGRKVGDRVLPIALEELHPDAVYFLAGTRYRVIKLDYPKGGVAKLERIPRDYPYYTRALKEEWPTIEQVYEKRAANKTEIAFCKLHIKKTVLGYANMELGQDVSQGKRIMLDTPLEYDFVTKGMVFHAPKPDDTIAAAADAEYVEASAYHATEHVIIEGSNMVTGGASQDLGGISMGVSGMIFVYDGAIGGSGASKALYDKFEGAVSRGASIIRECPCKGEAGCPRCTFSYRCGNNNEYLHKRAALEVLERMDSGQETMLVDASPDDRPLV